MRAFKSLLLILCVSAPLAVGAQSKEEREHKKYYEKWLDQDVVYIITDEERSVFSKLRTPEERDAFIEESSSTELVRTECLQMTRQRNAIAWQDVFLAALFGLAAAPAQGEAGPLI